MESGIVGGDNILHEPEKPTTELTLFDWLLIAIVVAFLCGGMFYVLTTPTWWGWCLDVLDVRDWTHWMWTGVAVALLVALWLVHVGANAGHDKENKSGDMASLSTPMQEEGK
jgi:hypothetical protein